MPDLILATGATPFIAAYQFTNTAFGTKYSAPATAATSLGLAVDFAPDNLAVFGAFSSGRVQAWSWSFSGFGTKYTASTGASNGIGVKRSGNTVFTAGTNSPYLQAYPWSNSTGFGTVYSSPSPLPGALSAGYQMVSANGGAVVVANAGTARMDAYSWSDAVGFGSRYSNPSTTPGTNPYSVFMNSNYVLVGNTSPATPPSAYPWNNSTGFGTRFSNPATAANGGNGIKMNNSQNAVALAGGTSPGAQAYSWSALGWGTKSTSGSANFTGVSFSYDSNSVFYGISASPYLAGFRFSGGALGTAFSAPSVGVGASTIGVATSYPSAYSLIANVSTFTLSGIAAGLKIGRRVIADSRSFALTGIAINLKSTRTLTANVGAFALSGQSASLRSTRTIVTGAGSHALSGIANRLAAARIIAGSGSAFSITTYPASLVLTIAKSVIAAPGQFYSSGIAAQSHRTYATQSSTGALSLSGQSASLSTGKRIVASPSDFALTSTVSNLAKHYQIALSSGSIAATGSDAILSCPVVASGAEFALTGKSATLKVVRALSASAGGFAQTGTSSTLSKGWHLGAGSQSLLVGSYASVFVCGRSLPVESAALLLSGQSCSPRQAKVLPVTEGCMESSGSSTDLGYRRGLHAAQHQFDLTGIYAYLTTIHEPFPCQSGVFSIPTPAASIKYSNSGVKQLPPRLDFRIGSCGVNLKPSREKIATGSFIMAESACALCLRRNWESQ